MWEKEASSEGRFKSCSQTSRPSHPFTSFMSTSSSFALCLLTDCCLKVYLFPGHLLALHQRISLLSDAEENQVHLHPCKKIPLTNLTNHIALCKCVCMCVNPTVCFYSSITSVTLQPTSSCYFKHFDCHNSTRPVTITTLSTCCIIYGNDLNNFCWPCQLNLHRNTLPE